jgi:hypothetical protein
MVYAHYSPSGRTFGVDSDLELLHRVDVDEVADV